MYMRTLRFFVPLFLSLSFFPDAARAGEQWAILIGVKEHKNEELNLSFSVEDVKRLKEVLLVRAGMPAGHILELTDEAPDACKPTRANLRRAVPAFLQKVARDDRILVFFSGHGFRHEGKTYLVTRDSNRDDLAHTGL